MQYRQGESKSPEPKVSGALWTHGVGRAETGKVLSQNREKCFSQGPPVMRSLNEGT